jgi:cyanophycin synthetase
VDPPGPTETDRVLEALRPFAPTGVNNFHFLAAADRLGVPWRPLLPGTYFFGTGRWSCRLLSSMTSQTSAMGVRTAHSKHVTARLLSAFGLPAPVHLVVASESEAVAAARGIGFPVVVKPDDQEQGRGVMAGLRDEPSVARAYRFAREHSPRVLVERHCEGQDFRMTVFRGEVVKIMARRAGGVVGDGEHTIRQLVEAVQNSPRFSTIHRQTGRHLLALDEEAAELLSEQGFGPETVLGPGVRQPLRRKSNISAGGEQILVPIPDVHPDNLRLAVRAAEALELDLAGVDLIIPDIRRSWFDSDCVINEVNAIPQIGITLAPETYASILNKLLDGRRGIPVHLLVLAGADPAVSELQRLAKGCNGLSTSAGVWVDGHLVVPRPPSGFEAARILLLERTVEAALCVVSAGELVRFGAPAARFASIRVYGAVANDAAATRTLAQALRMVRDFGPVSSTPVPVIGD